MNEHVETYTIKEMIVVNIGTVNPLIYFVCIILNKDFRKSSDKEHFVYAIMCTLSSSPRGRDNRFTRLKIPMSIPTINHAIKW